MFQRNCESCDHFFQNKEEILCKLSSGSCLYFDDLDNTVLKTNKNNGEDCPFWLSKNWDIPDKLSNDSCLIVKDYNTMNNNSKKQMIIDATSLMEWLDSEIQHLNDAIILMNNKKDFPESHIKECENIQGWLLRIKELIKENYKKRPKIALQHFDTLINVSKTLGSNHEMSKVFYDKALLALTIASEYGELDE